MQNRFHCFHMEQEAIDLPLTKCITSQANEYLSSISETAGIMTIIQFKLKHVQALLLEQTYILLYSTFSFSLCFRTLYNIQVCLFVVEFCFSRGVSAPLVILHSCTFNPAF